MAETLKDILFCSAKNARKEIVEHGEHSAIGEYAARSWWVLDALLEKAGLMGEFEAWEKNTAEPTPEEWGKQDKSVVLTNAQWNRLVCYINLSTKFREGELQAWKKLAEEKHPDGRLVFPNAPSHVAYWQELMEDIKTIRDVIDA